MERLHQIAHWAMLSLDSERCIDLTANAAGQISQPDRQLLRGGDFLAVPQRKHRRPLLPPCIEVCIVLGPAELRLQLIVNVVQLEITVIPVPAEHAKSWQITELFVFREVRQADLAVVTFTV